MNALQPARIYQTAIQKMISRYSSEVSGVDKF